MRCPRAPHRVLLSLFLVASIAPSAVLAAQEGPLPAGTAVNFADGVNCPVMMSDWTNPSNAGAQDNTPATFSRVRVDPDEPVNGQTGCLRARDFGFTIPNGSIIDGVVGSVRVKYTDLSPSGTTGFINAHWKVFIVKGDGTTGSTDKATGTAITTTYQNLTFGANNNTWGESLTYSDVNDADFGFTFGVVGVDNAQAEVDSMQMTVYYTAPAVVTIAGEDGPETSDICSVDGSFITNDYENDGTIQNFPVSLSWDRSVTGFTVGDISVSNGTIVGGSFSGSNNSYSISITPDDNFFDSDTEIITISIPLNAVNEGNAATSFDITYSKYHTFCDLNFTDDGIWYKLDEQSDTTAVDSPMSSSNVDTPHDGTLLNFTTPATSWNQCAATTLLSNAGALRFDGSDDYVRSDLPSYTFAVNSDLYVSLWFRSDVASPSSTGTLLQLSKNHDGDAANLLTLQLLPSATHFLVATRSVGGTSSAKTISSTPNLLQWNHVLVQVTSNVVTNIFVNGENLTAPDSTTVAGVAFNRLILGASYTGALDEVAITKELPQGLTLNEFAARLPAHRNADCSSSTFVITSLPGSTYTVRLVSDDTTNPALVGQTGPRVIRLRKAGKPILDASVLFDQNRTWGSVTAETDAGSNKAVVSLSGNHGHIGSHTLYVPKGSTNAVRICPNATSLGDITDSCTNGVLFSGSFPSSPQEVTFPSGSSEVTASVQAFSGTDYWKLTGVLGSGGGGENAGGGGGGGGGGDVPDMGTWMMILLGTVGVLFLAAKGKQAMLVVTLCTSVGLASCAEKTAVQPLDPVFFNLPATAREVVEKRTERTATFELSPGKFAMVSFGRNGLPTPSSLSFSRWQ